MNTLDVIRIISLHNPDISKLRLVTYEPQKDVAQLFSESWSEIDEIHYQRALDMRNKINLPFWNSLMLSIINGESIPDNCLYGTSRHNHITEIGWISPDAIDNANILHFPSNRKAINSTVKLSNGEEMHIPMLDFHIDISVKNTNLVKKICNILGVEGFLLNSGKSYHFIGIQLLSHKELYQFLGQALLFTPIVDEIWIAHQLQEHSCTLRFGEKHGMIPTVITSITRTES